MKNKSQHEELAGRVALITGAGGGLGAAAALALAARGANVVVNDLKIENAQSVARQAESLGRKTLVSAHDVSDHKAAAELVAQIKDQLGRLDILINNAGITRDGMLHKMSEDNWDQVIRVNLKGPFNVGQAAAKVMIEQKSGRIINIVSVALLGNIGQSNYSASKAGLLGMTKTWALELARHGITVNAIGPGFMDTAMTQAVPPEIREKFVQRIPLKKMGKPEDIANAVAFFAGDSASYVTGQCLFVDGGLAVGISGA